MAATRREVLGTGAGLAMSAAALARTGKAGVVVPDAERIAADLTRYVGLGIKASGGVGDTAVGDWLADELATLGFAIKRQSISTPYFDVDVARIETKGAQAAVIPQAIVIPTSEAGVSGALIRVDAATAPVMSDRIRDTIVLVDLPFARWSSIKPVERFVEALFAAGAKAVLLVTNGPTGKAIALNADGRRPMFAAPVAVLAPNDAAPFFVGAAHGDVATLRITGQGGRRPAFNVVATLDRGRAKWLVVSTPRSGWFTCAGERGPGVAVWLGLARWAAAALPAHNLAFICTSAHEYENLGAEQALAETAPPPRATALWLHLGANLAARDWHDLTPKWSPLTTADPQRYLVTSPALVEHARRIFAGQPGLADPLSSDVAADGELKTVIAAGYPTVAGVYGAHRFHHVREDMRECLLPEATVQVLQGFRAFMSVAFNA